MLKNFALILCLCVSCGIDPLPSSGKLDGGNSVPDSSVSKSNINPRLLPLNTKYVTQDTTYTMARYGQFYDTELSMECTVATADNGKLRCLPSTDAIVGVYFSDSNCIQNLAYQVCDRLSTGFAKSTAQLCSEFPGPLTTIYKIGPLINTVVYKREGVACVVALSVITYDFYPVLSVIAQTNFAEVSTSSVW